MSPDSVAEAHDPTKLQVAYLCRVSRRLTPLVPQPRHRAANWSRFPRSERFDRMFRNEGVTGSNPVISTEPPGQGIAGSMNACCSHNPVIRAPRVCHRIARLSTS
jgi:hypothetical protein